MSGTPRNSRHVTKKGNIDYDFSPAYDRSEVVTWEMIEPEKDMETATVNMTQSFTIMGTMKDGTLHKVGI